MCARHHLVRTHRCNRLLAEQAAQKQQAKAKTQPPPVTSTGKPNIDSRLGQPKPGFEGRLGRTFPVAVSPVPQPAAVSKPPAPAPISSRLGPTHVISDSQPVAAAPQIKQHSRKIDDSLTPVPQQQSAAATKRPEPVQARPAGIKSLAELLAEKGKQVPPEPQSSAPPPAVVATKPVAKTLPSTVILVADKQPQQEPKIALPVGAEAPCLSCNFDVSA